MIVDKDERVIIGRGQWGNDNQSLWRCDLLQDRDEKVHFAESSFHLRAGFDRRHVRVGERLADGTQRFTVRPIADVGTVLAEARWHGHEWIFGGDDSAWDLVPRFAQVWLADAEATALLRIDAASPEADFLEWWRDGPYDVGYQGVLETYEIPGSHLVIVAVQRDDRPVVYDPRSRQVVDHITLTTPSNPAIYFRSTAPELWVNEYDRVSIFRSVSWERMDSVGLQPAGQGYGRLLTGGFWFPPDEGYCLVARPFSGDVVFVDTKTFRVIDSVPLGQQPLEAIALTDGRVYARDWQTLGLLRGARRP